MRKSMIPRCAIALSILLAAWPLAAQRKPLVDACKLLTDAEVRRVFPDAKAATRDDSAEQYGAAGCYWDHRGGRFAIRVTDETREVGKEAMGFAEGFVDPFKPQSAKNVRIFRTTGVGDAAAGFIESRDAAKGILATMAILVVQRGATQITLFSNQLPERERGAAQQALEELGRAAARRA